MKKLLTALLLSVVSASVYAQDQAQQASNTTPQLINVMETDTSLVQIVGGLLVVVMLILGIAAAIKRLGLTGINTQGNMKVAGCLPLGSKEKIVLVEVNGEQLLIGVAPGFVGHVKTLDAKTELVATNQQEPSIPEGATFSERLMSALRQQNIK